MPIRTFLPARLGAAVLVVGAALVLAMPANAGVIYELDATNISYLIPSPLFTGNTVTGYLDISNSVGPGGSFGVPQLEGASFDIAGYYFTLADFLPGFDVDGRISADGKSIPFLEIGYDLSTKLPGCGGGCFGSFDIAQSQPSNLLVVSDPNFTEYGLVQFDTAFINRVPEPISISLFLAGLAGAGVMRRRKAKCA